jgi:SAM-dependent methyltransferase
LLERTGLIGPAFRAYERIVSLRPGRPTAVAGPALPPRRLMVRVAGTADADWFLRSGRAAYDAIAGHVPLAEIDSVLDFGCGCGRVTRYWSDFAGTVSGGDMSTRAVDWCRENLPFARFEVNRLEPPLTFEDESFDLAYALSVFTHLTDELQLAWRDELRRVLRPDGPCS